MSLVPLSSVKSMPEWVGMRDGGRRRRKGVEARMGYELVLLVLLCLVGSCSGALGGASWWQHAHVGCSGCGGSDGGGKGGSGTSWQQLACAGEWVEARCSFNEGGWDGGSWQQRADGVGTGDSWQRWLPMGGNGGSRGGVIGRGAWNGGSWQMQADGAVAGGSGSRQLTVEDNGGSREEGSDGGAWNGGSW